MKLDDIDLQILSILKQNSRTPNVEVAKAVGLTEGAVRHRIEVLSANRAIERFTIETGSATGTSFFGIVMLKARGDTKKMMSEVAQSGIPKESFEISGDYDGCLVIEGSSLTEVDGKIDRLRKLRHVADTKTFVVLRRW